MNQPDVYPKIGDIGCQCPKCKTFDVQPTAVNQLAHEAEVYDMTTCSNGTCGYVGSKYEFVCRELPTKIVYKVATAIQPGDFVKLVNPMGQIARVKEVTNGMIRNKLMITYDTGDYEHVGQKDQITVSVLE